YPDFSYPVAIQCLETAFGVSMEDQSLAVSQTLPEIFEAVAGKELEHSRTNSEPVTPSEDDVAEAERLKTEGNEPWALDNEDLLIRKGSAFPGSWGMLGMGRGKTGNVFCSVSISRSALGLLRFWCWRILDPSGIFIPKLLWGVEHPSLLLPPAGLFPGKNRDGREEDFVLILREFLDKADFDLGWDGISLLELGIFLAGNFGNFLSWEFWLGISSRGMKSHSQQPPHVKPQNPKLPNPISPLQNQRKKRNDPNPKEFSQPGGPGVGVGNSLGTSQLLQHSQIPDFPPFPRAAAYSKLGNYAGAVRDCERAIGIDPGYSKAYGRMG
ncbi:small glutamine-rich tetratricopeptide repeat-containing protein alpha, partial [Parus major]|uniref:small glutamine-rich tetratricopeptide repeat-containing protein alpha n=1 Tax=Parus major TaxID=9157 RepID=UPI001443E782